MEGAITFGWFPKGGGAIPEFDCCMRVGWFPKGGDETEASGGGANPPKGGGANPPKGGGAVPVGIPVGGGPSGGKFD